MSVGKERVFNTKVSKTLRHKALITSHYILHLYALNPLDVVRVRRRKPAQISTVVHISALVTLRLGDSVLKKNRAICLHTYSSKNKSGNGYWLSQADTKG